MVYRKLWLFPQRVTLSLKQSEMTQKQKAILQEIRELAIIGELEIKQALEESATIEEKWRRRADAKRAAAQKL